MTKKTTAQKSAVDYAEGSALAAPLFEALEQTLKTSALAFGDQRIFAADPTKFAAAILRPSEDTIFLFVALPRRGKPARNWRSVARFQEKRIAGRDVWLCRRAAAPLTATTLAALEKVHGNDELADYIHGELPVAEKVDLEGAAEIRNPSGSTGIQVRWRGLWHSLALLTRFEYAAIPPDPIMERAREQGAPVLPIV